MHKTLERLQTTLFGNVEEGTGTEHEDCYGNFKKLQRNSFDYAKTYDFDKLLYRPKFLGSSFL